MLETVSEVMEVERCKEVLEEESSLVEEVVPECSEVLRTPLIPGCKKNFYLLQHCSSCSSSAGGKSSAQTNLSFL